MSSPPPPTPLDLQVTVVSAKHLKNVNWRNGQLRPYATIYLDGRFRFSTRPDESGSTGPVWNEIFTLPIPSPSPRDAILTVDVFHSSEPSDVEAPKPFVGSSKFRLAQLIDSLHSSSAPSPPRVYSLELYRPSGRPQGKLRLKLAVRGLPGPRFYGLAPENCGNYSATTPASFEREYRQSSMYDHLVPCSSNYAYYAHGNNGCNVPPPPPPSPPLPRHIFHGSARYGVFSVPTAPVDYSSYAPEHRPMSIPPPVRVSSYNTLYRPSAPVDFSYPAEEEHRPIDPRRRLPDSGRTASPESPVSNREHLFPPPPPPWIFNHSASAPVYPTLANIPNAEDQVFRPIDPWHRLPDGTTTAPLESPVSNIENSIPPPPWIFNQSASAPVYPVPANILSAEWSEQRASPVAGALGRRGPPK